MPDPVKSSFLKRILSKEDAIIQVFRPTFSNKLNQALDVFERLVNEVETLSKLGIVISANNEKFYLTPSDLKGSLDEFGEMELIATKGREFLDLIGYVSQRRNQPMPGVAPVGQTVDIMPIETQLPGSEPLKGVIVSPKNKPAVPAVIPDKK